MKFKSLLQGLVLSGSVLFPLETLRHFHEDLEYIQQSISNKVKNLSEDTEQINSRFLFENYDKALRFFSVYFDCDFQDLKSVNDLRDFLKDDNSFNLKQKKLRKLILSLKSVKDIHLFFELIENKILDFSESDENDGFDVFYELSSNVDPYEFFNLIYSNKDLFLTIDKKYYSYFINTSLENLKCLFNFAKNDELKYFSVARKLGILRSRNFEDYGDLILMLKEYNIIFNKRFSEVQSLNLLSNLQYLSSELIHNLDLTDSLQVELISFLSVFNNSYLRKNIFTSFDQINKIREHKLEFIFNYYDSYENLDRIIDFLILNPDKFISFQVLVSKIDFDNESQIIDLLSLDDCQKYLFLLKKFKTSLSDINISKLQFIDFNQVLSVNDFVSYVNSLDEKDYQSPNDLSDNKFLSLFFTPDEYKFISDANMNKFVLKFSLFDFSFIKQISSLDEKILSKFNVSICKFFFENQSLIGLLADVSFESFELLSFLLNKNISHSLIESHFAQIVSMSNSSQDVYICFFDIYPATERNSFNNVFKLKNLHLIEEILNKYPNFSLFKTNIFDEWMKTIHASSDVYLFDKFLDFLSTLDNDQIFSFSYSFEILMPFFTTLDFYFLTDLASFSLNHNQTFFLELSEKLKILNIQELNSVNITFSNLDYISSLSENSLISLSESFDCLAFNKNLSLYFKHYIEYSKYFYRDNAKFLIFLLKLKDDFIDLNLAKIEPSIFYRIFEKFDYPKLVSLFQKNPHIYELLYFIDSYPEFDLESVLNLFESKEVPFGFYGEFSSLYNSLKSESQEYLVDYINDGIIKDCSGVFLFFEVFDLINTELPIENQLNTFVMLQMHSFDSNALVSNLGLDVKTFRVDDLDELRIILSSLDKDGANFVFKKIKLSSEFDDDFSEKLIKLLNSDYETYSIKRYFESYKLFKVVTNKHSLVEQYDSLVKFITNDKQVSVDENNVDFILSVFKNFKLLQDYSYGSDSYLNIDNFYSLNNFILLDRLEFIPNFNENVSLQNYLSFQQLLSSSSVNKFTDQEFLNKFSLEFSFTEYQTFFTPDNLKTLNMCLSSKDNSIILNVLQRFVSDYPIGFGNLNTYMGIVNSLTTKVKSKNDFEQFIELIRSFVFNQVSNFTLNQYKTNSNYKKDFSKHGFEFSKLRSFLESKDVVFEKPSKISKLFSNIKKGNFGYLWSKVADKFSSALSDKDYSKRIDRSFDSKFFNKSIVMINGDPAVNVYTINENSLKMKLFSVKKIPRNLLVDENVKYISSMSFTYDNSVVDFAAVNGRFFNKSLSRSSKDGFLITNTNGEFVLMDKRNINLSDLYNFIGLDFNEDDRKLDLLNNISDFFLLMKIIKEHKLSILSNQVLYSSEITDELSDNSRTARRALAQFKDGTYAIIDSRLPMTTKELVEFSKFHKDLSLLVYLDTGSYDSCFVKNGSNEIINEGRRGPDEVLYSGIVIESK